MGIPTEKSGHINDLVSQQKSKSKFNNRPQNFKKVSGVNRQIDQNSNNLKSLPIVNPEKPNAVKVQLSNKSPRKSKKQKSAVTHLIKNGKIKHDSIVNSSSIKSHSFERKRNQQNSENNAKRYQKFEKKS